MLKAVVDDKNCTSNADKIPFEVFLTFKKTLCCPLLLKPPKFVSQWSAQNPISFFLSPVRLRTESRNLLSIAAVSPGTDLNCNSFTLTPVSAIASAALVPVVLKKDAKDVMSNRRGFEAEVSRILQLHLTNGKLDPTFSKVLRSLRSQTGNRSPKRISLVFGWLHDTNVLESQPIRQGLAHIGKGTHRLVIPMS
ncbi:unnamed protein product [Clavelina lepadiformis]|uniref:Uncharacterized protein n=1 Tax=Clavelina lepadiformis TaxID=159417 RepID=A0ABP0F0I9_CLALP